MEINVVFYKSPVGILKIYSSNYAIKKIEVVKERNDFECSEFNYRVMEQFDAYFEGKLHTFNIPFENPGKTDFQKRVYDELLNVRYGKTISYKELAAKAGHPDAARAVGTAMAKNPLPLVIPCHRVIKADGSIGSYSLGGKEAKKYLLDFEKTHC